MSGWLAENNSGWLAENRSSWLAENKSSWLAENKAGWLAENKAGWLNGNRSGWLTGDKSGWLNECKVNGLFLKENITLPWTIVVKQSHDLTITIFTQRHIVLAASPNFDIAGENVTWRKS